MLYQGRVNESCMDVQEATTICCQSRGGFRGGDVVTCHHYNLWVMVHLHLPPPPPPPYPLHTHTHAHTYHIPHITYHTSHFLPPQIGQVGIVGPRTLGPTDPRTHVGPQDPRRTPGPT